MNDSRVQLVVIIACIISIIALGNVVIKDAEDISYKNCTNSYSEYQKKPFTDPKQLNTAYEYCREAYNRIDSNSMRGVEVNRNREFFYGVIWNKFY